MCSRIITFLYELNHPHLRRVSSSLQRSHDSSVPAVSIAVSRRRFFKQRIHNFLIVNVPQRGSLLVFAAVFRQLNHVFDWFSHRFRSRHGARHRTVSQNFRG